MQVRENWVGTWSESSLSGVWRSWRRVNNKGGGLGNEKSQGARSGVGGAALLAGRFTFTEPCEEGVWWTSSPYLCALPATSPQGLGPVSLTCVLLIACGVYVTGACRESLASVLISSKTPKISICLEMSWVMKKLHFSWGLRTRRLYTLHSWARRMLFS